MRNLLAVGALAALLVGMVGLGALRQIDDRPPETISITPPVVRTLAPSTTAAPTFEPAPIPTIGAEGAWEPSDGPVWSAPPPASRQTRPSQTTAPPPPVAPAPAPPVQPSIEPNRSAVFGLLELVNADRVAAGCQPVVLDQRLQATAEQQAVAQAVEQRMHHSTYPGYWSSWSENVAAGPQTAIEVHEAWMNSPPHRENILDCAMTHMGAGAATDPASDTRYWTEQFGREP